MSLETEPMDPVWFAEKTRQTVRDWCPECEPDVDQTTEYVTPYRCRSHAEINVAGDVDWRVTCDQRLYPNQPLEGTTL